tara:strand:+ start:352 stop:510 length:159 start_codon:yes stop_codon:yes gene_type:complete
MPEGNFLGYFTDNKVNLPIVGAVSIGAIGLVLGIAYFTILKKPKRTTITKEF